MRRRIRGLGGRPGRALLVFAAVVAGLVLLLSGMKGSGRPGAAGLTDRRRVEQAGTATSSGLPAAATSSGLPAAQTPTKSGASQPFDGTAAVGAMFTTTSTGRLSHVFCSATVVQSHGRDLAVTAAHCLTGRTRIAFVPGYYDGKQPHGVWRVTASYVDAAWRSGHDPDDDFAFLRLSGRRPVEDITGAERLGTSPRPPVLVEVLAYLVKKDRPVYCVNYLHYASPDAASATQLQFDCGGFTNGSSGGPFLADVSSATGGATVVGVIGGYDQGGPTSSVSYSAVFSPAVTALYHSAQAH